MADELHNFNLLSGYSTNILEDQFSTNNFQDAHDTRPPETYLEALGGNLDAIQGITTLTLEKHLAEALPVHTSPSLGPSGPSYSNWRKRLREIIVKQNESILGFLFKPLSQHPILGPVESALTRYTLRQDIDKQELKPLKQIITDLSANEDIQLEISKRLSEKGTSNLIQIKEQTFALLKLYKEYGEKLLETENQLKLRLEKMDKLQKNVSQCMKLQTNEATQDVVAALEQYLKIGFKDLQIETYYKDLITLYQKHYSLREAIQTLRTGNTVSSEPGCPICLNESVSVAIVPCGHTFCKTCTQRMMMECAICRGRIENRVKIYFA